MRALQVLTMALALATTPAVAFPNWQLSNTDRMIVLQGRSDDSVKLALQQVDTLIIERGDGGSVQGMYDSLQFLKSYPNKRVVINGPCYSACTLLLTQPTQVTFTHKADFFFHSAATNKCENGKLVRQISSWGNRRMWHSFNGRLKKWILDNHAFYGFEKFTQLSNHEAQRMMPEMVMPEDKMIHYVSGRSVITPSTSSLFPDCKG